jgi:sugar phosphate isomerase/epimerase
VRLRIAITAAPGQPRPAPLLLFGDIADAFRQAAGFGCQGVEIHMRQAQDVDVRLVMRLMADYGLGVPTLGTGMAAGDGLSLSHADAGVRARTVERVRGHIDFAAQVGSAVTIGSLSGRLGECRNRRSRALESLAEVCGLAMRAGVTVLLEPLNRYECDYLNTLADAMLAASEIGAPNLKLLADTFHMNIEEADIGASLKAAGSLVGHVHLADTNRQTPGHGHLNVAAVLQALDEIGYQGYLSLEVLPLPTAEQAIRDGMDAIQNRKGESKRD